MNSSYLIISIAVMAIVTYLIRMIPFVLVVRKIRSPFILNTLHYMPYAVLSAMTVPAVFFSSSSVIASTVGFISALILAYRERSLLCVASVACGAVFLCKILMYFLH